MSHSSVWKQVGQPVGDHIQSTGKRTAIGIGIRMQFGPPGPDYGVADNTSYWERYFPSMWAAYSQLLPKWIESHRRADWLDAMLYTFNVISPGAPADGYTVKQHFISTSRYCCLVLPDAERTKRQDESYREHGREIPTDPLARAWAFDPWLERGAPIHKRIYKYLDEYLSM